MYVDHIEARMMRYCILHRLSPLFGFASEDITIIISSRFVSKSKHMDCKKKALDRGKNRRKLTTAMISIFGYRVCFYSVRSGKKKCGVLQMSLMGIVQLRVHSETKQQAPSGGPRSAQCGGGDAALVA
jgi:hypothetical protein